MSQSSEQADSHKTDGEMIPSCQWGRDVVVDSDLIRTNLSKIRKNIVPCKTEIVAVTKYFGLDAIKKGYEAGLRNFGESRAQDSIEKILKLPEEIRKNSTFHFIGHLQSNKAENVVKYFDVIHSVDSKKLAVKISEAACRLGKREKILLQVNNAEEEQKFGYDTKVLKEEFPEILSLEGVEVIGLMNMATFGASEKRLRELFRELRGLRDELREEFQAELKELSMGMSDDYKIAVEEGSTMIRIGRKLFT